MRRFLCTALCVSALAVLASVPAAAVDATPEQLKARFLVQLLKYVSWPEEGTSNGARPYVIGIERDDAMSEALEVLTDGRRVNDRAIEVRRLADLDALDGLHVLMLAGSDRAELRRTAREQHGSALLTVAERFDFPELGGDVGIELVRGRVSFSINRRKSVRGPLKISAKLLRVASEVR